MSNDFSPLVSIVIPVYNGSNYLRQAIDSALAQTYKNIEVLVINDGSTDEGKTEEIARSYGDKIRYHSKTNGGVSTAINLGIDKMKGDYFSWLCHDDLYTPDKVRKQIEFIRKNPKHSEVVLYSDYGIVDENSKYIKTKKITPVEPEKMQYALITGSPINGCSVLVPRACFDQVGTFDERLRTTQDIDLWFRMAERYKFMHTPDVIVMTRIHGEQGQNTLDYYSGEMNDLWIDLMKRKTFAQWRQITGERSISAIFARFAIGVRWKRCFSASDYALNVSKEYMLREGPLGTLKSAMLISFCMLLSGSVLESLKDVSKKILVMMNNK